MAISDTVRRNVKLHHCIYPGDEIEWLGDVPYIKHRTSEYGYSADHQEHVYVNTMEPVPDWMAAYWLGYSDGIDHKPMWLDEVSNG